MRQTGNSGSRSRICVLSSGGMDSAVLIHHLAGIYREVYPLYVRCGLLWEKSEGYWLRRFLKKTANPRVRPLSEAELRLGGLFKKHWGWTGRGVPPANTPDEDVYIPGRNAFLLTAAAAFCSQKEIQVIALGILNCNPFPDGAPRFFLDMERVLGAAFGRPVSVVAPFARLSKKEVIEMGRDLPLDLTFSCIKPRGNRSCGVCSKCSEREKALCGPVLK